MRFPDQWWLRGSVSLSPARARFGTFSKRPFSQRFCHTHTELHWHLIISTLIINKAISVNVHLPELSVFNILQVCENDFYVLTCALKFHSCRAFYCFAIIEFHQICVRFGYLRQAAGLTKEQAVCAVHLIKRMIRKKQEDRLNIEEVASHPLFWTPRKKIDFYKVCVVNVPVKHSFGRVCVCPTQLLTAGSGDWG